MSAFTVYANMESIEATLNGTDTVTFNRKSKHIMLMNDSASDNLQFKFHASEAFATLQPTESFAMEMWVAGLLLSTGAAVPYRIWVFG
tara:strand:- start:6465 stop:6728 length:264 start_codon:yes stop_codon:yes gene_type:complete